MKKFSASLFAVSFFIFALCGCEQVDEPLKISTAFEATCDITTADISMKADVVMASIDDVCITVQSPEDLKGLIYHKVNSTLYIEHNGLKCTTVPDYLCFNNPFEVIFDAVSCINTAQPKSSNESIVFIGEAPHGKIELFLDENRNITKIKPEYTDCKIELKYR